MSRTLLRGAQIVDGTGTEPFPADVIIDGGRITGLPAAADPRPDDDVLDLPGTIVTPGLIDAHVHVTFTGMDTSRLQSRPFSLEFYQAEANLRRLLDTGVTTARDAGGADLGVKTAVQQGLIDGPRLHIAITVLSQTGGHADGWTVHGDDQRLMVPHPGRPACVVDGVDAMRTRVRQIARAGADLIKVCASGGVMSTRDDPGSPQFGQDELDACVREAADTGRPVMAHAHAAEGIKRALRAGVRSIEHGVFLDDEGIELLLQHDAWLVPTLLAPIALVEAIDAGMTVPPAVDTKARSIAATHLDAVRRAHQAGVKIAMGTDSGVFPHGSSPRELGLLMQAGLTPLEALRAATSSAADLLRLPDVGRIRAGAHADLAVTRGPRLDPAQWQDNLMIVMQAGRIVRDYR